MSAAVQDTAAVVAVAQSALAQAETTLAALERDHDASAAELDAIDALGEEQIDTKVVLAKERAIRRRRRLASEITASRSAVREARASLADAERDHAASQARAHAAQLVTEAAELRAFLTDALGELDARVADLRARDAEARRLADEGQVQLDRSWCPWLDANGHAALVVLPAELDARDRAEQIRAAHAERRAEEDRRERERRAELSVEERRAEAWRRQWAHLATPPEMPRSFRAPDEVLAERLAAGQRTSTETN